MPPQVAQQQQEEPRVYPLQSQQKLYRDVYKNVQDGDFHRFYQILQCRLYSSQYGRYI